MEGGKGGRKEGKKERRKEVTHNAAKPSEANGSQGYATRSSIHSGHGTAQNRYFYEAYVEVTFQRLHALSAGPDEHDVEELNFSTISSEEHMLEEHVAWRASTVPTTTSM